MTDKFQITPSNYSKIALAVYNDSDYVDYEQENDELLDDVKHNLEMQIDDPRPSVCKHNVKDDGSFTMCRLSGLQRKNLKDDWNQIEYLVKFVFYDTSIHGGFASVDDFCVYKIEKNDGKIALKKIETSFSFSKIEFAFFDKLNDDDFKNCIQNDAITLLLLKEIMH